MLWLVFLAVSCPGRNSHAFVPLPRTACCVGTNDVLLSRPQQQQQQQHQQQSIIITPPPVPPRPMAASSGASSSFEQRSASYQGQTYTYVYKPAATTTASKQAPPLRVSRLFPSARTTTTTTTLLLIHPVGIGLCNWFWEKLLMETRMDDCEIYSLNLLGCCSGMIASTNATTTTTTTYPGEYPWAEQIYELLTETIRRPVVLVTQGACAPLASQVTCILRQQQRQQLVSHVVLSSPPPTSPTVDPGLFSFLTSSPWGSFAFDLLETVPSIRLFSNLFLFDRPCDNTWTANCIREADPNVRRPVAYTNAGYVRDTTTSATTMITSTRAGAIPTLVLRGAKDPRRDSSSEQQQQNTTTFRRIPQAKNVVAWEQPAALAQAILEFVDDNKSRT